VIEIQQRWVRDLCWLYHQNPTSRFRTPTVTHLFSAIQTQRGLDLRVGPRFLGGDLDPPTAYNSLTSESQHLFCLRFGYGQ